MQTNKDISKFVSTSIFNCLESVESYEGIKKYFLYKLLHFEQLKVINNNEKQILENVLNNDSTKGLSKIKKHINNNIYIYIYIQI